VSTVRFIVTRPEEEGRALAARLAAAGHEMVLAPLLAIAGRAAAIPQHDYQAVLLTSANGARALARHPDRQRLEGVAVHAVGPASAAAMREAGWRRVGQAGGDVTALIEQVRRDLDPASGPLLYVSGETVSGDLEGTLRAAGFAVDRVVLYAAEPVATLPEAAATALVERGADGVLLYSPRTAQIWVRLATAAGLDAAAAKLRHLCLSQAVAARVGAAFPEAPVAVAERPDEEAMLALALAMASEER
jgi:uroporphyrinogen-III synthase